MISAKNSGEFPKELFWLMLGRPFKSMQGIIEYATGWLFTRDKYSLLGFLPVLLLIATMATLAIRGWSCDRVDIAKNIADLVDDEFRRSDKESKNSREVVDSQPDPQSSIMRHDASLAPKQVTPFAEMLLKRLVHGDEAEAKWRYIVALQLGQRQRLGQARQMMRKIAPKEGRGFAPAHAWLAWDAVSRSRVKDHLGKLDLIADLEKSLEWTGTGPALIGMLADLLESEGRIDDAMRVLEQKSKTDAGSAIKLFALAQKHGRVQNRDSIVEQASAIAKSKVVEPAATDQDYFNYASLSVMRHDVRQAIRTATEGLAKFPQSKLLARAHSEALRIQYLSTLRRTETGVQCDLHALNEALKADPTNEAVAEEVAKLMAAGANASPELAGALEQQSAEGHASALTYLLLSEVAYRNNRPDAAVPHLEAALRRSPNSVAILNNLALTLARLSNENLPRAMELIDRAIALAEPDAELFDTQGEIRMRTQDFQGAVESFENAIGLDRKRTDIRARLVQAYKKAGLHDMAKVQQAKINELAPES